jgi:hypothetical protein
MVGILGMYVGYVLFCNKESQQQCLSKKNYACAGKESKILKDIAANSVVFLYNMDDKSLLGPFTALPEGDDLDAGAWAMDIDENIEPYASVNVTWENLHLLQNAPDQLPFLKDTQTCRLSTVQTQRALDMLKEAPLYINTEQQRNEP